MSFMCARTYQALLVCLAMVSSSPLSAEGEEATVDCRFLYEIAGGLYVDAGAAQGLSQGLTGWLRHEGRNVARIEVDNASSDFSFLRIVADRVDDFPKAGSDVTLAFDESLRQRIEETRERSPTLKDPSGGDPLTPLLAPFNNTEFADTQTRNAFHGRVTFRTVAQTGSDGDLDAVLTRIGSSGSVDRVNGSPWAFEYAFDLSYRDGDAYDLLDDYQKPRFDVTRLSLFRRFDDESFVRYGRFLPRALPSIGYVDGFAGEKIVNDRFRVGVVTGLKPSRDELHPTFEEPVLVPYVTMESGAYDDITYSGTAGLLGSLYDGDADRLAFLFDQYASFGKWKILSSSEVDFDVGAGDRDGVRLTRWDLSSTYSVSDGFDLRAGFDRFEVVDNDAQRDLVDDFIINEDDFFDDGFTRVWVGGVHVLSEKWTMSEEISFTDTEDDDAIRGYLRFTRKLDRGSWTLTLSNIAGEHLEGVAGRISGYFPVSGSLSLHPSVGAQFSRFDTNDETDDQYYVDAGIHGYWHISKAWSFTGGVRASTTDEEQRYSLDLGITMRW